MKRLAVIGLGRFGYKLAVALASSGAEVIAIDRNRTIIDQIRSQVSLAVRLDSVDINALRSQNIHKIDAAIVGMGQGAEAFESSVMTVVNLKQLGVRQIFARAENPTAGQVLTAVGANEVIYPEVETAQRWAYKLLAPHIDEKIDFAPGYSLARIKAPASFDKKTVKELQLRQKYNVNLVAIRRNVLDKDMKAADIINVPMPDTVINTGDILMVAGADQNLIRLPKE